MTEFVLFCLPTVIYLVVQTRGKDRTLAAARGRAGLKWAILPVQFAAGLLLGWLRHTTGTLVPGAAVHAVANCVAGLLRL